MNLGSTALCQDVTAEYAILDDCETVN